MIPGNLDLDIFRGDDFSIIFRMKDSLTNTYVNLTDRQGRAQIRANALSDTVLATFTVTVLNQTTVPGGVSMSLTPTQTAALPLTGGVWDVELFDAARSWVRTPLAGTVNVLAEVTR